MSDSDNTLNKFNDWLKQQPDKQSWRDLPPTDKQLTAIANMEKALGIQNPVPIRRGWASDRIAELKKKFTATRFRSFWDSEDYFSNGYDYL